MLRTALALLLLASCADDLGPVDETTSTGVVATSEAGSSTGEPIVVELCELGKTAQSTCADGENCVPLPFEGDAVPDHQGVCASECRYDLDCAYLSQCSGPGCRCKGGGCLLSCTKDNDCPDGTICQDYKNSDPVGELQCAPERL